MTMYHGTSKAAAARILIEGMEPGYGFQLAENLGVAIEYSFNGFSDDEGGAVIAVDAPTYMLGFKSMWDDEVDRPGVAWLRQTIPPAHLRLEGIHQNGSST